MFNKPKMTSDKLVQKMKDKGITFDIEGEEVANEYLKNRNNYFRIASADLAPAFILSGAPPPNRGLISM